jgi:dienelactone hydrolase
MVFFLFLVVVGLVFTACEYPDNNSGNDTPSGSYDIPAGCGSIPGQDGSSDSNGGQTDGTVEATYAATGPYTVTTTSTTGYKIYYPRDMDGNHPIVTWGNGTGAPTFTYNALLKHLASWGFVVIASDSTMTQSGEEMVGGIDYLIQENSRSGSIFYQMLDTERIGTTGHSQGGGGAINAATDSRVTCTAPLAPSPGQITQVKCPIFLVAGSADMIVSATLVRSMSYGPATAPTIFGIIQGAGHMSFSGNGGQARGYVTAWFRYYLQEDQVAQQAFVPNGELFTNSNWDVEEKNF